MRVFITGATSGFGALMVDAFLNKGATVIASGRRLRERTDLFQEQRRQFPDRFFETDLDVTDPAQRTAAVAFCRQKAQGLDILINNAGAGLFGSLEDCGEEQIRKQIEVNFFGTALVTKEFLPLLRENRGRIFNFSSVLGFQGLPLTSLYNASKFAVEGLSEGIAYELQTHGVQVCIVQPGSFRTNFMSGIDWAARANEESSVYRRQSRNYQKIRHDMVADPSYPDPKTVVQGVLRLASKKRMPLRATFGKDAALAAFTRKLLPREVFYRLTSWIFRRQFDA